MSKEWAQGYYYCGRCKTQQFYLKSEDPSPICDVCGYEGLGRNYTAVPPVVKISLA